MIGKLLTVYEDVKKVIQKFFVWRKVRYEDKVDKAVDNRNEYTIGKLMHDIHKKRAKRHKQS